MSSMSPDQVTLVETGSYITTNIKIIPVTSSRRPSVQTQIEDRAPDGWSNSSFRGSISSAPAISQHHTIQPVNMTMNTETATDTNTGELVVLRDAVVSRFKNDPLTLKQLELELPSLNGDELQQLAEVEVEEEEEDEEPEALAFEDLGFYDLTAKDANGNIVKFSDFKGKIVLITNIASQCTARHQLALLEALWRKYKEYEFVLLGFPSNQFFQERHSSNEAIVQACSAKYDVTFPIMDKVSVNGEKQHDVFRYLKSKKKGFLRSTRVKWNFEKFLIDREGNVLNRYSTLQKKALSQDIDEILKLEQQRKI